MAGFILWQGLSMIDGESPVVVVGIKSDRNRKTGTMVQTYILRADMAPGDAIRSGADAAICGGCVHRGDGTGAGRTCYVDPRGMSAVWRALQAGSYPVATDEQRRELGRGAMVRLGTYGDPLAAPLHIWLSLLAESAGHTGYTHQWRTRVGADVFRGLCMASVETDEEARAAEAAGWRYYRTRRIGEAAPAAEIDCPSPRGVQCADCGLCSGTTRARARSVSIEVHGVAVKRADRLIATLQVG